MSFAVGYCARNKRYRNLSPGLDEAVALAGRMLAYFFDAQRRIKNPPTFALFMNIILETVWLLSGTNRFMGRRGVLISRSWNRIVTFIFRRNLDVSINGNTRTCEDSELVSSTIVSSLCLFSFTLRLSLLHAFESLHLDLHGVRLKITHGSDFAVRVN